MAWIELKRRKDGTVSYWIRDRRDGRHVVIAMPEGVDRAFAERMLLRYEARRNLEKHGYDDGYGSKLLPIQMDVLRKAQGN